MEQHQRRKQREEEPHGWDPRDEPNQGRHEDEAYGKRGEREHWSGPPPSADAAGGSSSSNWDRAAGIPPQSHLHLILLVDQKGGGKVRNMVPIPILLTRLLRKESSEKRKSLLITLNIWEPAPKRWPIS